MFGLGNRKLGREVPDVVAACAAGKQDRVGAAGHRHREVVARLAGVERVKADHPRDARIRWVDLGEKAARPRASRRKVNGCAGEIHHQRVYPRRRPRISPRLASGPVAAALAGGAGGGFQDSFTIRRAKLGLTFSAGPDVPFYHDRDAQSRAPAATRPRARRRPASGAVVEAIRQGAAASGTSFDYLLATAQRESALVPTAKAQTSSAAGLFQFIEQTWLGLVKSEGAKLGLEDYAGAILPRAGGGLSVADPHTKQAILRLREDPVLAATLAGTLAQQNGARLSPEIGRPASGADLYVAHVLGARGAADLIKAVQADPTRAAALDFPEAAAANRRIFYDPTGRARGVAEVYNVLGAGQSGAPATGAPAAAEPPQATSTMAVARPAGPVLQGLFQTEPRPGPVSDAVARVWRTHATSGAGMQAAVRFFPRETTFASLSDRSTANRSVAEFESSPYSSPAESRPPMQSCPRRPPRPHSKGAPSQTRRRPRRSAPACRCRRRGRARFRVPSPAAASAIGRPLDLLSYAKTPR